jgi:hypothetical protein
MVDLLPLPLGEGWGAGGAVNEAMLDEAPLALTPVLSQRERE